MLNHDIRPIGVNDHAIDLFEGQYVVPGGMSYNSYVILDEKIAVLDTVDADFGEEWLDNLRAVIGKRPVDYLIIQHMEPDHSSNIARFMQAYPQSTVVTTDKAAKMIDRYFGEALLRAQRPMIVSDGDTLSLGTHTLTFVTAPMVHWPEVMLTYDTASRTLFSADAFGKFGALDIDEPWVDEAARYYFGIVGKFGAQVQALFKKVDGIAIDAICPLHGPVLTDTIGECLSLYNTWSSYQAEKEGIVIAYTSVYGHTRHAVQCLADALRERNQQVIVHDLARCDTAQAVADAFRHDRLVLATTTYNGDIFPPMREFIHELGERSFRDRTVGLIENGSWAPIAAKKMTAMLTSFKGLTLLSEIVTVRAAVDGTAAAQIAALADRLCDTP